MSVLELVLRITHHVISQSVLETAQSNDKDNETDNSCSRKSPETKLIWKINTEHLMYMHPT